MVGPLVDDQPVRHTVFEEAPCEMEPHRARFGIGRIEDGAVDSVTLLGLMNGTTIAFRYHLEGLGYHRARFSLRRSKQALYQVLGEEVVVVDVE